MIAIKYLFEITVKKNNYFVSFTTFIMFETKNFAFFNESLAGSLFA